MAISQGSDDQRSESGGAQASQVVEREAEDKFSGGNRHGGHRAVEKQAESNPRNPNYQKPGPVTEIEAPGTSTSIPHHDEEGTTQHSNVRPESDRGYQQNPGGVDASSSPDDVDENIGGGALREGKELAPTKFTLRFLESSKLTLLALLIYALTIYIAVTAADHNSPLGLVLPNHGILILHLLSKAGDIAFAAAAGSVWCNIQWKLISGTLKPSLASVFALSPWTDVLGLWRISCRSKGSRNDSPRFWSIARLLAICCLPGPGVILMSDVNVENLNFPVGWNSISGGMGIFDHRLVDIFKQGSGPYISGLIQNLLRDPAISLETKPISTSCNNSNLSCTSFLLPGGVQSVSPWPFNITAADESNYIVQNGPAYQIDFSDISGHITWNQHSCHVYGSDTNAFQLCIQNATDSAEGDQLISGWRVCPANLTAEGECNQPGLWNASEMWTTSMTVYRRAATVSASRTNWVIFDAKDLSQPTLEKIDPSDLFTAFDAILTFAHNESNISQCSMDAPEHQLTKYLYIYLNQSTALIHQSSSIPLEYLRNLLVTPLYLCNPVMLTAADSAASIQPGLPQENYLLGSYAIPAKRAVPGRWTVWTYTATGGMILLVMFAALAWASLTMKPETSSFPIADLLVSSKVIRNSQEHEEGKMRAFEIQFDEIFTDMVPGKSAAILNRADMVKVKLKTEQTTARGFLKPKTQSLYI